ncbi:MAG: hypothetical protein WC891_08855 [Actinomycetota bacterium]
MRDLIKLWSLILLVLILGLCMPKCSPAEMPVAVSLDAGPLFAQTLVQLSRGDNEATVKASKALFQFAARAAMQGTGEFAYTLTTGARGDTEIIPQGLLQFGALEFGEKNQGSRQNQKPVQFDLTQAASHRLELYTQTKSLLQPALVAEVFDAILMATGEVKGKQVSDTERFQRIVGGLGARFIYETPPFWVSLVAAASANYQFVRADLLYELTERWGLGLGGEHVKAKFGDVTISRDGFMINLEVVF